VAELRLSRVDHSFGRQWPLATRSARLPGFRTAQRARRCPARAQSVQGLNHFL